MRCKYATALCLCLLPAAGPAWSQQPQTRLINVRAERVDGGPPVPFPSLKVETQGAAGFSCESQSGLDGVVRCTVPCNPKDAMAQTFIIRTERRTDYNRQPAELTVRADGCTVSPDNLLVTYKRLNIILSESRTTMSILLAASGLQGQIAADGTTASSDVATALKDAIDRKQIDATRVAQFMKLSSDLAAYTLEAGDNERAGRYAAYSTATVNTMLADIATQLGIEQQVVMSGSLRDYFRNIGSVTMKANDTWGAAAGGTHANAGTWQKLEAAQNAGKLDYKASTNVFNAWKAHRGVP